ncbi:MAG: mevalonate kinase [Anaerolineales bacterium]|nr:mevalonate kinase [Anaerolineales bacterium]
MKKIETHAPGKVILFGEHAVVYGRPAIAVPVTQVNATATITPIDGKFTILAADLDRRYALASAPEDDPLALAVRLTLDHLDIQPPSVLLCIESTIPIASGMGSGAAVSVAILRAMNHYLEAELTDEMISELAFQVEKLYHGSPSGIDNTVVTYCRPVYYVQNQPIQTISMQTPFRLLVADTGISSPTRIAVGDVRDAWQKQPDVYDEIFDQIGKITIEAREAIENGRVHELGELFNQNQTLLRSIEVSSPELEMLIEAALTAGASGAKLSGAGRGGNMIALVEPEIEDAVVQTLYQAGAVNVIGTWVGKN